MSPRLEKKESGVPSLLWKGASGERGNVQGVEEEVSLVTTTPFRGSSREKKERKGPLSPAEGRSFHMALVKIAQRHQRGKRREKRINDR